MTDEQIISALECCKEICAPPCGKCPLNDAEGTCEEELIGYALDLINRQKAEIEQLRHRDEEFLLKSYTFDKFYDEHITKAKSEAIKEFADKLKNKIQKSIGLYMNNCSNGYVLAEDVPLEIDCLVEEMTED